MKRTFYLFFLILLPVLSTSQVNTDSLENLLNKTEGKEKIRLMTDLCWELGSSDREKAYEYGLMALKHSREKGYDTLIAQCYNDVGTLFIRYGGYDSAIFYLNKSLKIRKELKDTSGINSVISKLAVISEIKGDYSQALEYDLEALKIFEKLGDLYAIGTLKGNIALVYYNLGQVKLALKYNTEQYKIGQELENDMMLMSAYATFGNIYDALNIPDSAIYFINKALPIARKLKDINNESLLYQNMSTQLIKQEKFEEAESYLKKALEIRLEMNDKKGIVSTYTTLAEVATQNNKKQEAFEYLEKALKLAKELGLKERLLNIYQRYTILYRKAGNYEKALLYQDSVILYNDSLRNESFTRQIAEMETKYETEKKEQENIALKHKAEAEEKKKEKQQAISIASTAGGILVLLFAIILFNRLKVTRKQKQIIELQKERVDEFNEELNQQNEEILTQRDKIESQKNVIEEKHKSIQQSINYARRIQTAILPPESLIRKHLQDSFVLYQPKDVVAGDFYWMENIGDHTFFAVADCTGHGVPGAMVSVVCHGALNRCVREYRLAKPSDILDKTRVLVLTTFEKSEEQVKDGMDISLIAWNRKTDEIQFSGANNPLYILRKSKNDQEQSLKENTFSEDIANEKGGVAPLEIIKADKQPIGFSHTPTPFTNHKINWNKGDTIYLFSDGYADQFGGPKGKKMGYGQFRNKLLEYGQQSLQDQQESLNTFFTSWKGSEDQIDDVCIWGVKL